MAPESGNRGSVGFVQTATGPSEEEMSPFMLFETPKKPELKKSLETLPERMENPYQILRRFVKWEIMDLQAILDTIDQKDQWRRIHMDLSAKRTSDRKELLRLQTRSTYFMSQA